MSVNTTTAAEASHMQSSLDVMQAEVFDRMLVLVLMAALIGAVILDGTAWTLAAAIYVGIGLSCLWGFSWRRYRRDVAATGFCVGCFATTTAIVLHAPDSVAPMYYAVVVAIVVTTRGARHAAAAAVAACAMIQIAEPAGAVSLHIARPDAVGLILLVAVVSWLATSPIDTALQWSWNSYARAMEQTERLRDQQGLLNRTIKGLDEANRRLKAFNEQMDRMRVAALDARRRKAEFVVNLSHELRTPLNLILGFSRMMLDAPRVYGDPLPHQYREDAQAVYRNTQHLAALLDDVLDLSQIEAGRMGLWKERVRVADLVGEAVAALAGLYEHKGLQLRVELPPNIPEGYFDRTRVRQILINLLSNAVRFTDSGGVVVRAHADEETLTLIVSDTGIGIQPEDQPHIWDEFRQFGPLERRRGGSGMGLAISRSFATLHHGKMWVESVPGEGSTFYVSLPHSNESDLAPVSMTRNTLGLASRSRAAGPVVVLTDDAEAARLVQRHLDGYPVVATQGERRAARYARAARARAIIVIGPEREETERMALAVMHHAMGLPVLTCTLPNRTVDPAVLGVAAFIPKPVPRERLAATLRRYGRKITTILIIDDDQETVELLGRLVRSVSRRYKVASAIGGAEALAMLERDRPDAVILDLLMPGIDGCRVLTAVRAYEHPEIPVIVVSGQPALAADVRVASIGIGRSDGLTVREAMRCLQHALETVEVSEVSVAARSPSPVPVG